MDEIGNQVKTIVSQVLCVPTHEIDETILLAEHGLNSIDLIDVIAKLENQYQIKFNPDTMHHLSCRVLTENIHAFMTVR